MAIFSSGITTMYDDQINYSTSSHLPMYSTRYKNVLNGYDSTGIALYASIPVCRELYLGHFNVTICYDYDTFTAKTEGNNKILFQLIHHMIYSHWSDDRTQTRINQSRGFYDIPATKNIYGKLVVYYRKNSEKKLEKFFVEICNEDFLEVDEFYLKYYLQAFCVLFENNYFDYDITIEQAVLNVQNSNYMCTDPYKITRDARYGFDLTNDYVVTTYSRDENPYKGYELCFSTIRPNSMLPINSVIDIGIQGMTSNLRYYQSKMYDTVKIPVANLISNQII